MTKKDRQALSYGVSVIFLFISLYLYWIVFKSSNVYVFFGILLAIPLMKRVIYSLLPTAKSTRKRKHNPKKKGTTSKSKRTTNKLREDRIILASSLKDLSWREFERLCFLYFKAKGYKPRETKGGADGGVDLIIYNRKNGSDEAVQIKHYINSGNNITVEKIRELNSAKRNHKCVLTRFITTSRYTKEALKQADMYNMICHDINWVEDKIVKWQKQERKMVKDIV